MTIRAHSVILSGRRPRKISKHGGGIDCLDRLGNLLNALPCDRFDSHLRQMPK